MTDFHCAKCKKCTQPKDVHGNLKKCSLNCSAIVIALEQDGIVFCMISSEKWEDFLELL